MNALVVIPARGGSKGLPGKNIKPLNGKPMINYTVEAAREVFDDSNIIVSTDSEQIKKVVEDAGLAVPFLRPSELASDTSTSHDVLLHALDYYAKHNGNPDVIILLQVTSPLRTSDQIKGALSLYSSTIDMVVSVKETESNPYYVLFEENQEGLLEKSKESHFARRQDCPPVWELNGATYVINPESLRNQKMSDFKKIKKYLMDARSSVDIDSQLDFDFVNVLVSKGQVDS